MTISVEDPPTGTLMTDANYMLGYNNPELAAALNLVYEATTTPPVVPQYGPKNYELQGGRQVILPLIDLAQTLGLRVRIVIDDNDDSSNNVVTVDMPKS